MNREPKHKRILLKVSGEYLGGEKGQGFDPEVIDSIADQICKASAHGVQVAVVVGGGNLFRGANAHPKVERTTADYIGMMGTIMNGAYLQQIIESKNTPSRLMSSIPIPSVAETFIRRRAVLHLERGEVVILVAGTGNPLFSTDTAAVLRGRELNVEIVVKGTLVDGIYDKDPKKHKNASRYEQIDYGKVLQDNLRVMDSTAVSFARDYEIPIYVMNIGEPNALMNFLDGQEIGTRVTPDGSPRKG